MGTSWGNASFPLKMISEAKYMGMVDEELFLQELPHIT